jgi:hypothetical protein
MIKICITWTQQQFKETRNEILKYLAKRYLKPTGEGENAKKHISSVNNKTATRRRGCRDARIWKYERFTP